MGRYVQTGWRSVPRGLLVGVVASLQFGVVASLALAACGSATTQLTGPTLPGTTGATASTTTTVPTTTTTTPVNHVGAAVTLTGPGGLSVIVQVASLVDPATAANSYDAPGTGMRYAAVRLAINDTGPVALATDLLEDVAVVDSSGTTVTPVVLDMANCPVIIGGEVSLAPHAPVDIGCVALELPSSATLRSVHVAVAAGPGGQATWAVP